MSKLSEIKEDGALVTKRRRSTKENVASIAFLLCGLLEAMRDDIASAWEHAQLEDSEHEPLMRQRLSVYNHLLANARIMLERAQ